MPRAPLRPCCQPGCPALVKKGRCPKHNYDKQRGPDRTFYNKKPWRDFRAWFLAEHPLCVFCLEQGRTTAANVVDHVKPRKEFPYLAYDSENCRALCTSCHNRRTRTDATL